MTVIGGPVAVDGNANLDAVLGEKLAKVLVKQDPVSVDPQIEAADAAQRRMELRDDPPCSTTCTVPSACEAAWSAMR